MDGWDEWMGFFFLDGNGNLKKKKKSILYPPRMCCSFSFMKMCAYRFLFALPAFDRIFQRPPPRNPNAPHPNPFVYHISPY